FSSNQAPPHVDGVWAGECGSGFDDLDTCVGKKPLIDSIEARDFRVLVGDQCLPIEAPIPYRPPVSRRLLELLTEGAGIDHQLLRDAADVHTGTSQMALLCDSDPLPGRCGHTTRAHAS